MDTYTAATVLAANIRCDAWPIVDALRSAYPDGIVPVGHLDALGRQLEESAGGYSVQEVDEEAHLDIVKPAGWPEREIASVTVRAAEISYPTDKAHLVFGPERVAENAGDYGFHYIPYNFDSRPEADFFD